MKGGKSRSQAKSSSLSVNKKAAVSKAAVSKAAKPMTKKEKQAAKDPNKPKRPASAFFVFMEDFRPQYKAKHPQNKAVSVVGKAGGDKWKSMTDAEKAPFVAKAEKRKAEYEKNMKAYNKKQSEAPKEEEEEESEKSSEVNNEDEDDDEDGSEEDESDD